MERMRKFMIKPLWKKGSCFYESLSYIKKRMDNSCIEILKGAGGLARGNILMKFHHILLPSEHKVHAGALE
jgi:hypothetical protein